MEVILQWQYEETAPKKWWLLIEQALIGDFMQEEKFPTNRHLGFLRIRGVFAPLHDLFKPGVEDLKQPELKAMWLRKLNQEKVLELQDGVVDSPSQDGRLSNGHNLEDNEITALCWASSNGTVLALSPAERKLLVIVLHWLPNSKSQNDYDGQLFVYGGSEIGSEEVLTVLTLEWSARMKTLRCVGRAELTLSGPFSDMRLLLSTRNNHDADLLVKKQPQGEGPKCSACFQIFDSPVQALHYVDDGAKLAVSCEYGRVAVLDMDAFSVSLVYNGDHVKIPKGARPKDIDKPVNKLMFVCTKDATLNVYDGYDYRTLSCKPVQLKKDTTTISMHVIVIRVLGMEELKVSLTKANNEDNRRKKQMVHLRIILDLQSKSLAGEASTAAAAPKCCLSNVLVLKEVSHYCLGTRMICAASVYFMLLMQDLMLPVVISYVNAAIDTTAIGFKRSPGCIFTLTACTLGLGPGCIFTLTAVAKWECSSYGRALALHARGTGFDSPHFLIFSLCD
ncbi:synaptobrevin, WD40/YVTN repeat-like-containing domain protein [Tanacetum coccineum]